MKISKNNQKFCSVIVDDDHELTPLNMKYTGEMNGGVLTLQIHQLYQNNKGDQNSPDSQAVLVLPKNRTHCITGIECFLNDQKIDLKIEEEKRAKEITQEAQKQGRTTFRSSTTPDEQFLNIHLGSISYGSKIQITIRMEIISANIDSKTYQTIIPFSEQPIEQTNPADFSFSIVFNEILPIDDIAITCSYERYDFEYTFDGSILTIDKKPLGPIVILTKFSEEIDGLIQNDLHDEYSVISVVPHFSDKPINSDFIFIVDCSGSMSGSRIRNASECLSIFLHSLPVGCKFNIIMFGSDYRSVFGRSGLVDYNEENLNAADKSIKNLRANMGGTNLLGPLSFAYEQIESNSKKGNVVQIFLLTDGEIHDTETVFKLVSKNRSKSRIFSIGIGKDADRNLVSGLAVLSLGKFDFVSESSQITDKVVNLLSLSLASALTNISVHASSNDGTDLESLEIVPNPLTPIYDGNLTTIFVKRNNLEKPIESVLISGNIGDTEQEIVINETINCCEQSAKKLFAFNAINDYEKLYNDLVKKKEEEERQRRRRRNYGFSDSDYEEVEEDGENKPKNEDKKEDKDEITKLRDRIVQLSIENGILSRFTSYVGVENEPHRIRNGSSSDEEEVTSSRHRRARVRAAKRMAQQVDRESEREDVLMCSNHAIRGCFLESASSDHSDEDNSSAPNIIRTRAKKKCAKSSIKKKCSKSSIKKKCAPKSNFSDKKHDNFDITCASASDHIAIMRDIDECGCGSLSDDKEEMDAINDYEQAPRSNDIDKMCLVGNCSRESDSIFDDSDEMCDEECSSKASENYMKFEECCERSKQCCRKRSKQMTRNSLSNKNPPPPKLPEIERSVTGIVSSQDFDGKWKSSLFDQLFKFVDVNRQKVLDDFFIASNVMDEDVKSTVVALCVLHKLFNKEHARWKLVENKAIRWLNSKLQKQWDSEIPLLASQI